MYRTVGQTAALLVALALVATACGDDDAETTTTAAASATTAAALDVTDVASEVPACLDTADLYALLGPESIGFDDWSDANDLAAEIGAPNTPYPDMPLDVTAPGEETPPIMSKCPSLSTYAIDRARNLPAADRPPVCGFAFGSV